MAEHYGVPVILHSDHCAKKLLPWFDGMLEADEKHFKEHGTPLFSSHMLDLSEEPHEEVPQIDPNTEYSKGDPGSKRGGFAKTYRISSQNLKFSLCTHMVLEYLTTLLTFNLCQKM